MRITLETKIDDEKILLSYKGSAFWATNSMSCITGVAKSRKSFARDLLVGKMFTNDTDFIGDFTGRILIVDTEQSNAWVKKSLERLKSLGVDTEKVIMLALKQYPTNERKKITEQTIRDERVEMVFVDGIRDFIHDFNDVKETAILMNDMMRWVQEYKIHLGFILHTNPDGHKVRGTLGTEVLNKCDTVVKISTRSGANTSTVAPVAMRDKDFISFKFEVNADGLPLIS